MAAPIGQGRPAPANALLLLLRSCVQSSKLARFAFATLPSILTPIACPQLRREGEAKTARVRPVLACYGAFAPSWLPYGVITKVWPHFPPA